MGGIREHECATEKQILSMGVCVCVACAGNCGGFNPQSKVVRTGWI